MTSDTRFPRMNSIHTWPSKIDSENGFFTGIEADYAYGFVENVDPDDNPVDVWSFADETITPRSDVRVFPTVSGDFFMASSSASDTSVQFTVSALTSTGDQQFITATTNASDGRTPVQFGSGLDINFVFLSAADQENLGEIYFTNVNDFTLGKPNDTDSVLAHVPIGYGCSPQSMVRVPNNKRVIVTDFIITLDRSNGSRGSAEIHLRTKREGGSWVVSRRWNIQTGTPIIPAVKMTFEPGSIVVARLENASDTNTNLGVEMQFYFVDIE